MRSIDRGWSWGHPIRGGTGKLCLPVDEGANARASKACPRHPALRRVDFDEVG